jgi:hypothetical protein
MAETRIEEEHALIEIPAKNVDRLVGCERHHVTALEVQFNIMVCSAK